MKKISAGLMMYRVKNGEPEVLLVHPGGPFFKNRDDESWSIPKGEADTTEEEQSLLEVAKREFKEETSFTPEGEFTYVGSVKRKDGKVVEAWAFEGDADPTQVKSNTFLLEWPPHSGKKIEIPEVDRGDFFTLPVARVKIASFMRPLIDLFEETLQAKNGPA